MRLCTRAIFLLFALMFCTEALAQTLNEQLSAENPAKLAEQARRDGDIVRGAILFHQGNINCAKCHKGKAETDRIGPDLSRMEKEITDEHIIESILQPSKIIKEGYESYVILTADGQTITGIKVSEDENKIVIRDRDDVDKLITIKPEDVDQIRPGKLSNMPANLANELKNRQQFLDLLRYVMDVKERGPEANPQVAQNNVRRELTPELDGLVLIQKLNCVACHGSDSLPFAAAAKKAPRLKWSAATINPEHIEAFIANPHGVKSGTTMPELFGQMDDAARAKTASAITHFLLSQSENEYRPQPIDGEAMHVGFKLFNSVGCVACHSPRNESAEEQGLADSTALGDLSKKYNIDGLTKFLKDPLAARPSGHMPNMRLTHREAVEISNYLLQSAPETFTQWKLDPELAMQGELFFKQQNCVACHIEIAGDGSGDAGPAAFLPRLEKLNPDNGCLAEKAGDWPNYHLSESDRKSIRAALKNQPMELSDQQRIEVTLTSFNCIACHDRGDFGGVTQARNPHFQTEDLNLGDQGRIPPTLTGVGAKLNPKWMRDVLVNRRSIRPYMNTRMPQYGEENVGHLLKLFQANDRLPETKFAEFDDQKETRKKGHVLAGNKGLNCVACHTYQYKTSDTMPAVDLTEMTERLKKDWFYQYMLDPQAFSPNTVMPSFWPGGQAIRADIEGSPEDQVEALWQYLVDGRQARAPAGVVREPLEIIVTDEAKMLRRSYSGIGKRGIGVGYPGGVNITFDAEQMRLASIWKGKFAEAGGVWRGQGHGTVRPLEKAIEFTKGPDLDDVKSPWVVDEDRPPKHQFKGYTLDKSQRPTFMYEFDTVSVKDFFSQVTDESANNSLRRNLTMSSETGRSGLRFRVANSATMTELDGVFSIGKQVTVRVVSNHKAVIAETDDGKHLIVPIEITAGKQEQVVLEYFWK